MFTERLLCAIDYFKSWQYTANKRERDPAHVKLTR